MALETQAQDLAQEAASLRSGLPKGSLNDSPSELHEQLLRTRAVADRIGAVLEQLVIMRAKAHIERKKAEWAFEDAWNKAATSSQGFSQSEPAAQERYAQYTMRALEEKVAVREAEHRVEIVEASHEVGRIHYWAVDAVRRDLDLRIRLLIFDKRLES